MLTPNVKVSKAFAALVVIVAALFGQDTIQAVLNALAMFNAA